MKNVIESWVAVLVVLLIFILGVAFTSVNMHVLHARRVYNDIKAEIQASNGQIVGDTDELIGSYKWDDDSAIYKYTYRITRQNTLASDMHEDDETYIYNELYKVELIYVYTVPYFGRLTYPLTGFTV